MHNIKSILLKEIKVKVEVTQNGEIHLDGVTVFYPANAGYPESEEPADTRITSALGMAIMCKLDSLYE